MAAFRFNKNPWTTICVEAINLLLTKNIPIEETITKCTDIKKFLAVRAVKGGGHKNGEFLGKVVRWYYAKGEKGTINYVNNNNKVPTSDGARPLMDLPNELPSDIDFDRYISDTKSMLVDLGHTRAPGELSFFGV